MCRVMSITDYFERVCEHGNDSEDACSHRCTVRESFSTFLRQETPCGSRDVLLVDHCLYENTYVMCGSMLSDI